MAAILPVLKEDMTFWQRLLQFADHTFRNLCIP